MRQLMYGSFAVLMLGVSFSGLEAARCRWENMMVLYKCKYELGLLRGESDMPRLAVDEYLDWFKKLTPRKAGERPALLIEFVKRGSVVGNYQLASWKIIDAIPEDKQARAPAMEVMKNQAHFKAMIQRNIEKL